MQDQGKVSLLGWGRLNGSAQSSPVLLPLIRAVPADKSMELTSKDRSRKERKTLLLFSLEVTYLPLTVASLRELRRAKDGVSPGDCYLDLTSEL